MRIDTILPAALLLALAGCGGSSAPAVSGEATSPDVRVATAAEPQSIGTDGMTAIDAALADGKAMPAGSYAPSAYELASRLASERPKQAPKDDSALREARATAPAAVVRPARRPGGGDTIDLLRSDDSVTVGG